MSAEASSLLILANSGRSMAESASRGAYRATVLDRFADQDTLAVADCWPIRHGFSQLDVDFLLEEMASLFPKQPFGLVYGAGLEEASSLLARLSQRCQLFGNDPSVLEMLSKPRKYFSLLNQLQIPYPKVCFTPPYASSEKNWLIKRAGSCGGQGVAYFDPEHSAIDASCYFQKYTLGAVMSILFIADGERHRTLGFNRLGLKSSNAPASFLYTGAIGQASISDAQRRQIEQIVEKLVLELALRGINSVDFILNGEGVLMLELNPRPTATLELYEHLVPDGWIKHHIQACQGELPAMPILGSAQMHGQQIVYTTRAIEIASSVIWPEWVKDRPAKGAWIASGQPLCSLNAQGNSADEVETRLQQYQDEMLNMLYATNQKKKQSKVAV